MAIQGEAYISVRADLKPYHRDLDKGVKETIKSFESAINKEFGKRLGRDISDGTKESLVQGAKEVSESIKESVSKSTSDGVEKGFREGGQRGGRHFKNKNNSPWVEIAGGLASALDDGISALPLEIKAGIVAGLIAVSPLVIAGLGGAVAAGVTAGVSTLGVVLAAQYQDVSDAFVSLGRKLRTEFVLLADVFRAPVIRAIDSFEKRIDELAPVFEDIFEGAADAIDPLMDATLDAVEDILYGIRSLTMNSESFVAAFGQGLRYLGTATKIFFQLIADGGDDGARALEDLLYVISSLIIYIGYMIRAMTVLYGAMTKVWDVTKQWISPLSNITALIFENADSQSEWIGTLGETDSSLLDLIKSTDGETKALEELNKATQEAIKGAYAYLDAQIAMEQAIDDATDALKENGGTLDIDSQKGRDNAREIENAIQKIVDAYQERVNKGEISAARAQEQVDKEIKKLRDLVVATGGSAKKFDELYGSILKLDKIEVPPEIQAAVNRIASAAGIADKNLKKVIQDLYDLQKAGKHVAIPGTSIGGVTAFGDGGIVDRPTFAMVGEAGREAVLPLSQPQRSAQILAQTPLAGLLGGGDTTVIAIFDGEPFQARITRTVNANNAAQAAMLSSGPRMF